MPPARTVTGFDGGDVRNTRSMSLAPEPPAEFHMMDRPKSKNVAFLPIFSDEAFSKLVAYGVIVEMWEKTKFGRVGRRWREEFTPAERAKVRRYYGRFYKWHLVSGPPKQIACRMSTMVLLQRAAHFFATV